MDEKELGPTHLEDVELTDSTQSTFTAEEEAAVIRKLDYRLLPIVFVLYSLSVLDRSNLGNAKLAGLEKDIDLTDFRYNWLGTAFYIAYILFQWTLIGWKQFPPHRFAAFCVFFWGFVATIQATVTTYPGLVVCRIFLGIAESGYGPGVPLYLSYFYPRKKVGFRQGVFISGAAMANAYGGALAYGLSQIQGSIALWRILFIIEGIPTCCLAVLVWFFLPDSLNSAKFLDEREKAVAKHYLSRQQKIDDSHEQGVRLKEFVEAFKDPKCAIPPFIYFSCNVSFASLPLFLPTIISQIGTFSTVQSNGMSAPPYLLCFFMIIFLCFLSDRTGVRGPYCAGASFVAAIGFILSATVTSGPVRYFATFLSVQVFCCVALTLAWVANINSTESKRAGAYTFLATIGQCGPLLGTNVFPASEAPYYRPGQWISAAFCLLITALSISLSLILIRENRKIAKAEAAAAASQEDKTSEIPGTGMGPGFRYIW